MLLNNASINPVTTLTLVIGVLLLVACLLISGRQRLAGLRLFLLVSSAALFTMLTRSQSYYLLSPEQLLHALQFAIGPAFYLFVCGLVYVTAQSFMFKLCHFLPMLVVLAAGANSDTFIYLGLLSQLGYLILSLRLVRKYHFASFFTVSYAESTRLYWVYYFVLMLGAVYLLEFLRIIVQPNLAIGVVQHWNLIDLILVSVAFGFLVNKVLRDPPLFDGLEEFERQERQTSIEVDSVYRENAKQLFRVLRRKVYDDRWYRSSGLSVQDLAGETGASLRDTSWAIAQGAGTNFCDFVNEMRVEAVKSAMGPDTEPEQIEELSQEVGFSHYESFKRAFRKFTGYAPEQYAKHHLVS